MTSYRFAGSAGLMDVPAPNWVRDDPTLFSQWGMFLLTIIRHGSIETLRRADNLTLSPTEFAVVIEGGLYALDDSTKDDGRKLMVQFLRRGDLFSSTISNTLHLKLVAHCRTSCLVFRERAFDQFMDDFPSWERFSAPLKACMAQAYAEAVSSSVGRDQDRIRRVLALLANHPTATETPLGREIEAGKQQIRELAGVQKRSATRAFRALEEDGCVSFYGYKRLFYREAQCEQSALQHQHQQARKVRE